MWLSAKSGTGWNVPLVPYTDGSGGGTARYVGLAKTHAQHIMEAVAYNLYRTPGIIVSNSLK